MVLPWRDVAAAAVVVLLVAGCQGKTPGATGASGPQPSASASGAAFPLGTRTAPAVHATRGPLTVASAGFTESEVMAALYSALLTKAGYAVTINVIANSDLLQASLEKGDTGVVLQVAGSYADQLNRQIRGAEAKPVATGDLRATMAQLAPLASSRGVTPLQPTAAVDERAFAVGKKFAARNALTTLTDLGRLGVSVKLAADADCATAPSCQPGLLATYGIKVSVLDPLGIDTRSAKNAVQNGKDQLAVVLSTDNTLAASKLVTLTDDKHLQPVGNLLPIVNAKTLAAHPDIGTDLNRLVAVLSTADVAALIAAVDVAAQRPADVANAYLISKGLL